MESMRSNNTHKAITHLAMPQRQIPVLIDSTLEESEGLAPSCASDNPVIIVRRLLPSFVKGLASPQRRREIEKEHGTISATKWKELRELLDLKDRLNASDQAPIITSNAHEELNGLVPVLDRLGPEGWSIEREQSGGYKLVSGHKSVEIKFGKPRFQFPSVNWRAGREAASKEDSGLERDGIAPEWSGVITATSKTPAFALAEAFTAGLSNARFVVWWSDVGKKLVPGVYCPDIVTALYALAMWSGGTEGGWAICQRCHKDYARSRAKQRYCSHKCRVAAGMKRYRERLKRAAKSQSKATAKSKKRKGRK